MKFKTIQALALGFLCVTSSYAGKEDWKGTYKVKVSETETWDVIHTPTHAKVFFLSVASCLHLSKGASLNGVIMKEDMDFCVAENVPKFTKEIQKLGTIVSTKITLGSSYSENDLKAEY